MTNTNIKIGDIIQINTENLLTTGALNNKGLICKISKIRNTDGNHGVINRNAFIHIANLEGNDITTNGIWFHVFFVLLFI